jgi:hypothetical protein
MESSGGGARIDDGEAIWGRFGQRIEREAARRGSSAGTRVERACGEERRKGGEGRRRLPAVHGGGGAQGAREEGDVSGIRGLMGRV